MLVHLIGGRSDGMVIDTEKPDMGWCWNNDEFGGNMLPDTLRCHAARANRTVYRLCRAEAGEGWYQIDREETAAARLLPSATWWATEED